MIKKTLLFFSFCSFLASSIFVFFYPQATNSYLSAVSNKIVDSELNSNDSDLHSLSLDKILNSKNSKELVESTDWFKKLKKNLINEIVSDNKINFSENLAEATKNARLFFEKIKDYGYYGNIGETKEQRVNKSPFEEGFEYLTVKKTLPKFQSELTNLTSFDIDKFNKVIMRNPFGFLPSNLSQLFYYLKLDDIGELFNIPNQISSIKANFNDESGTIEISIEDINKNIYGFRLDQSNSFLKKTSDFWQYIYDRSFRIKFNLWSYVDNNEDKTFVRNEDWMFKFPSKVGTCWIVDRIKTTNKNDYEFLIASNAHVFDLHDYYDMYAKKTDPDECFKKYWNGGFYCDKDTVKNEECKNKPWKKYQSLTKVKRTKPIPVKVMKYPENDVTKLNEKTKGIFQNIESLNSETYIDIVYYTPLFESDGVKALDSGDTEQIFEPNNYEKGIRIGKVTNGGVDFAVSKIKFTKEQIKLLFPSLYEILNDDEKQKFWYAGLGKYTDIIPSDSIMIGGFDDENNWSNAYSNRGRISVKDRYLSTDKKYNDFFRYWTKYNKEVNEKQNKIHDIFKRYEEPFKNMKHGMTLTRANTQGSIYYYKPANNKYLVEGCSGSLAVNSRFEPIGLLSAYSVIEETPIKKTPIGNGIALFNSIKEKSDTSWLHSIWDEVTKKLNEDKIKTYKLNP